VFLLNENSCKITDTRRVVLPILILEMHPLDAVSKRISSKFFKENKDVVLVITGFIGSIE
jgi:hypothetical protein